MKDLDFATLVKSFGVGLQVMSSLLEIVIDIARKYRDAFVSAVNNVIYDANKYLFMNGPSWFFLLPGYQGQISLCMFFFAL